MGAVESLSLPEIVGERSCEKVYINKGQIMANGFSGRIRYETDWRTDVRMLDPGEKSDFVRHTSLPRFLRLVVNLDHRVGDPVDGPLAAGRNIVAIAESDWAFALKHYLDVGQEILLPRRPVQF